MNRNITIDLTKLLMSFFIVALHCLFMLDINEYLHFYLKEGLFRIAVPLFLLISGYYFYNSLNKKWLFKILKLYGIWMVIYIPFWLNISSYDNIKNSLITLLTGYYHLWFLLSLFLGGYLTYIFKNKTGMLLFLSFIFLFVSLLIEYLINYKIITINFVNPELLYRNVLIAFPFFVFGFLINKNKGKIAKFKSLYLSLMILLLIVMNFIELQYNYINSINRNFDLLMSTSLLSVCLFILILKKSIYIHKNYNMNLISNGIFFTHIFILNILKNYIENTIYLTLSVFILSLLISYLLLFFCRKVL